MYDISRFIKGFKQFQQRYFCGESTLFDTLKKGQHPKALVITCVDSRIDPALLTGSNPGDLLVVRNVAGLVPPYERDDGYHGVSAALEFAVTRLELEHIIVLGHSSCGGVNELLHPASDDSGSGFLGKWVTIASHAREQTLKTLADKPEKQQRACEQAAILVSLENLLTFPWISERVDRNLLYLHGWYFDMDRGELSSYLPESGTFEPLAPRC